MKLLNRFKRDKQLTINDEFHKYSQDLLDLTKLRERAMQKMVLQQSPASREEVARYDIMIGIAQRAIIEISDKKEKPPVVVAGG